jgi:hypothetical protein
VSDVKRRKMKNFASDKEQQAGTHGCNNQYKKRNRKKNKQPKSRI